MTADVQFPPLPEPALWLSADTRGVERPKMSDQAAFSILQMRAYAEEAVRLERARAAAAMAG
jgi:hypothetical protein